MIHDRSGVLDLEAAGVMGESDGGSTWNPGPSAATRAADITGGRGDYTTAGGGVWLPSLRCHQEGCELCLRFVWDGGSDRQKDVLGRR